MIFHRCRVVAQGPKGHGNLETEPKPQGLDLCTATGSWDWRWFFRLFDSCLENSCPKKFLEGLASEILPMVLVLACLSYIRTRFKPHLAGCGNRPSVHGGYFLWPQHWQLDSWQQGEGWEKVEQCLFKGEYGLDLWSLNHRKLTSCEFVCYVAASMINYVKMVWTDFGSLSFCGRCRNHSGRGHAEQQPQVTLPSGGVFELWIICKLSTSNLLLM